MMIRAQVKCLATLAVAVIASSACSPQSNDANKADKADQAGKGQPKPAGPRDVEAPAKPEGGGESGYTWTLPKGLSEPPTIPADNPMSADKVALGHRLFMDKRLSG